MAAKQTVRPDKSRSTFSRMFLLFMAVLLTQVLIYLLVFFKGGIVEETENNAFYILSERTANRKLDLENDMVGRWTNLEETGGEVYCIISDILEENDIPAEALLSDNDLCLSVVSESAVYLTEMLRRNGVTGAFLVLDCPNADDAYPGVYIRDYDPDNFTSDNRDLLLERGLPHIAHSLNITMDSYWSGLIRFDEQPEGSEQFFFSPIEAARAAEPKLRSGNYFYRWSERFSLSEADRPVIAYSVPLVWDDGTVLGVLGIDLTIDYLAEQLKYDELGEDKAGSYFLGITRDGGASYSTVCTSGPTFRAYFGQPPSLTVQPIQQSGIVKVSNGVDELTVYGAVQPLKLYNSNTPFEDEQWALIGLMNGNHLLQFTKHIRFMVLVCTLLSFLMGIVLVVIAARSYTRPLSKLVTDLRNSNPEKPIRLGRIHISEIDALTEAIENLSNAAAESASRISKIISMSQIPIGVFEYKEGAGPVFCSKSLFSILEWEENPQEDVYLQKEEFLQRLAAVTHEELGTGERVYRLAKANTDRWVQLFFERNGESMLGAVLDVTADMETKRKIEYERDYDMLTDLYNRRAFDERVERYFHQEDVPLNIAALLMLDLDNLKYVNDTYGHDYGDRYIQAFAKCLRYFYRCQSVVGRRSGDEFNVFLYGYASQEDIRATVEEFWSIVSETNLALPGGEQIRIRASGGLAWYPVDATNYKELFRLADFAMYSIKHTVKGLIQEFDRQDYDQKSILIQGQDALNQLIDNHMVRYALQPIVSAVDGSVFGYEFLMRPLLEQLSDLEKLFLLAKAQSKLMQIETLTWFEAMDTFARMVRNGKMKPGQKCFINTLGSQQLSDSDFRKLEQRYGHLLDQIVVELTETEEITPALLSNKKEQIDAWGALLALDDFGTGYNSQKLLMEAKPDIVKIDISIIRDIDTNQDHQTILRNLIDYVKDKNTLTLAEGVETAEEMDTLIHMGVDLLQGYYLGRPAFEVQTPPDRVIAEIRTLHRKYWPDQ